MTAPRLRRSTADRRRPTGGTPSNHGKAARAVRMGAAETGRSVPGLPTRTGPTDCRCAAVSTLIRKNLTRPVSCNPAADGRIRHKRSQPGKTPVQEPVPLKTNSTLRVTIPAKRSKQGPPEAGGYSASRRPTKLPGKQGYAQ